MFMDRACTVQNLLRNIIKVMLRLRDKMTDSIVNRQLPTPNRSSRMMGSVTDSVSCAHTRVGVSTVAALTAYAPWSRPT